MKSGQNSKKRKPTWWTRRLDRSWQFSERRRGQRHAHPFRWLHPKVSGVWGHCGQAGSSGHRTDTTGFKADCRSRLRIREGTWTPGAADMTGAARCASSRSPVKRKRQRSLTQHGATQSARGANLETPKTRPGAPEEEAENCAHAPSQRPGARDARTPRLLCEDFAITHAERRRGTGSQQMKRKAVSAKKRKSFF